VIQTKIQIIKDKYDKITIKMPQLLSELRPHIENFYLAKIVYFRKIAILLLSNQKFDNHENKKPHTAHPEASPTSFIPYLGCR